LRAKKLIIKIVTLSVFFTAIFLPSFSSYAEDSTPERNVIIVDNGLYFQIQTNKKLVSEILVDLGLSLKPEDRIYPSLGEEALGRIIIERATSITILVDGGVKSLTTFAKTAGEALAEAQVSLDPNDELNYSQDTLLFSNMEIVVTRIKLGTITKDVSMPFQTVNKKDDTLLWGKFKVIQEGKNGLKEQVYKVVYENGEETKRVLETETILQKPQDKIILEGTKIVLGEANYGIASFYRYGDQLTCASTHFPIGTPLKVTNTENGRKVIVTVNDYGPFVPGRIVDLNIPAFEKIAPLGAGLARVKVEEILD